MSTKMTQDEYITDMMTEKELETGPSEVAGFYAGCNVLLTGGSGFLGRLLIDKILRSCPDVNTLFLLVREKKGKSPEKRLQELFEDVIFDRLRRQSPGFARKVTLIEGDMSKVGLGLSPEQKSLLRSTNIIIHGAATVRFDAEISTAVNINVRGTTEMLSVAEEMPHLKAFVHVSTAYSHCVREEIDEKFYTTPIDSDKLLRLVEILDYAALDHLTPVLLGKWPNTYAFTKAVAEDVVRRSHLPVCIVRPSIVIATWNEPLTGWINNYYGPTGVLVGGAVGLLHTMLCDMKMVTDLIPADYVVNGIIVAAWDVAKARSLNSDITNSNGTPKIQEPAVYNIVSSCQNPITWEKFVRTNCEHAPEIPSALCLWYTFGITTTNRWVYLVCNIFLHFLPAAIADTLARFTGRKPMLWKAYKKINKFSSVMSYFSLRQWQFHNNNVLQMMNKMNPADRILFDLDVGSLNWEQYFHSQVRGIRVYLLKDPLSTVPQAKARYANRYKSEEIIAYLAEDVLVKNYIGLRAAHYTLVTALCGLLLWLLWTLLRFVLALWIVSPTFLPNETTTRL